MRLPKKFHNIFFIILAIFNGVVIHGLLQRAGVDPAYVGGIAAFYAYGLYAFGINVYNAVYNRLTKGNNNVNV